LSGPAEIVMRDDRVFEGTPLQIVHQMQSLAFGAPSRLPDYLAWVTENARSLDGVGLALRGDGSRRAHASISSVNAASR
jgi:hypothetical protein